MHSKHVKLRSASQRFLHAQAKWDRRKFLVEKRKDERRIGRERERMQENAERRKERKVYSKVVRKWLGKRSVVFS